MCCRLNQYASHEFASGLNEVGRAAKLGCSLLAETADPVQGKHAEGVEFDSVRVPVRVFEYRNVCFACVPMQKKNGLFRAFASSHHDCLFW